jgi:hypothetical protein
VINQFHVLKDVLKKIDPIVKTLEKSDSVIGFLIIIEFMEYLKFIRLDQLELGFFEFVLFFFHHTYEHQL